MSRGGFKLLRIGLTTLISATAVASYVAPAQAAPVKPLQLGMDDKQSFIAPEVSDSEHDFWFDRAREAGIGLIRMDLTWRSVLVDESVAPADPTNPADPNYDFTYYDEAVRRAHARGMDVLLTVWSAPLFAEGPNRPPVDCAEGEDPPACAPVGTWKPDPQAFAAFATAVATRYSGSFVPQGEASPLPPVDYFQAWNEPNLSQFLNPQVDDSLHSVSVSYYRPMLNAFYDAVHSVQPNATVLGPGTAPVSPGDSEFWVHYSTAPLDFLSALLCTKVSDGRFLAPCPDKPKFDLLAHNAIPPRFDADVTAPPNWPNSLIPSNFGRGVRLLRNAEAKGRVLPVRSPAREVWATEVWVGSNPPDSTAVSLSKQAWNIQTSMRLLSKAGASAIIYFKLRDNLPRENQACYLFQCGVGLYPNTATWPFTVADEPAKPALTAFSFPFTVERSSKTTAVAWFRPPLKGNAVIEQLAKGKWTQIAKLGARKGVPVTAKLSLTGKAKLRARMGSKTSLDWALAAKG